MEQEDWPSKDTLLTALAKSRELMQRYLYGNDAHKAAAILTKVLEAELALMEACEEFANKIVEGLQRFAPTGDPETVQRFLDAGKKVVMREYRKTHPRPRHRRPKRDRNPKTD